MVSLLLCYGSFFLIIVILIFPKLRNTLRYFLAFFFYFFTMTIGTTVYSFRFMFKGPSYSNSCEFITVYRISRWLMGLSPVVYGSENLNEKEQRIFIVNHQSFIDVLSLSDLWKEPTSVIAKDTLRFFGFLGLILHYSKVILIKRKNHDDAIVAMKEVAEIMKRDKINLFMFPEGTRNDSGKLMKFKKGAFHLAIQTKVPIQPVVISCYNSFLDHKTMQYNPVPFGVYVLPPIPTAHLTEDDTDSLLEQTRAVMDKLYTFTFEASRDELGSDLSKKLE